MNKLNNVSVHPILNEMEFTVGTTLLSDAFQKEAYTFTRDKCVVNWPGKGFMMFLVNYFDFDNT